MIPLFKQLEKRDGASVVCLSNLLQWAEATPGDSLPADYLDFMSHSNGATGRGPDLFVILDKAEDVAANTERYGASEYAPGLVIIGSDGYGNLIVIDIREASPDTRRYLRMDALAIDWVEQVSSGADYADSLLGILEAIAFKQNGRVNN